MARIRRTRCEECGRGLPPPQRAGRPRRFCSDACRQAARDRRRGGWQALDEPSLPSTPLPPRRRTLEALAGLLEGVPPAPAENQLARALLETRVLSHEFRRLARELRGLASARAQALGDALEAALRAQFPEAGP